MRLTSLVPWPLHNLIPPLSYCLAVRTSCVHLLSIFVRFLDSPRLVMKLRPSRPLAWCALTTHAQDWRVMSRVIGTCSSEMRWLSLDIFLVLVHVVIMRPSFRAACACSCGGGLPACLLVASIAIHFDVPLFLAAFLCDKPRCVIVYGASVTRRLQMRLIRPFALCLLSARMPGFGACEAG